MNSKLKIALALLVLFAALFVFLIAEHMAKAARIMLPLAAIFIFGYLVFAARSLLRSSNSIESEPTNVGCGEDCGCKETKPAPKAPRVASKGK